MNMPPSVCLLLLLLLGIAQTLPVQEKESHKGGHEDSHEDGHEDSHENGLNDSQDKGHEDGHEAHEEDTIDITTRILTANNGSKHFLFQGDLLAPKTRNAIFCADSSCFWTKYSNGYVMIPYVISNEYTANEAAIIENAMTGFYASTCIRFVRRTNEYDFISIVSKGGCYSELGRKGGLQELSLNRGGCIYRGIIEHELNHALGFQHEQCRSDRDSYVQINWENIIDGDAYNFYKQQTNNLNTPYDYSSIMHYGRDAFSVAYGRDTITPIPNPNVPIGQRNGLSFWDVTRINILYNCQ
ncbi:hatching enzyme like protease precursor [Oryzias latipes]|uniref:Metalloendopeptidase n=1 Tax=Oryzias latipes TaxID=8090 RepID=Q14TH9_ORYLA|nr:hatching enzyme like protease precursor [Oryzias latipes]BAE97361.1 hatching enzyme like protease [Oryzias latipes]